MTKPNSTEIVFVVDRSGSMTGIAADMQGGFDAFIAKQRKVAGECKVTLVRFDTEYEIVYSSTPLDQVAALVLEPRGSTALLDALGRTIDSVGRRLGGLPEAERPSQVLFVVVTDGQENASHEYGRKLIFDMITHQREKYGWEFVFLGANQDSIASAQGIGISVTNSVTFKPTSRGTGRLLDVLSDNVTRYRSSGRARMDNLYDQASYDASDDANNIVVPKSTT